MLSRSHRCGWPKLAALLACISVCTVANAAAPVKEQDLKAALTLKMVKYVEWPPSAFSGMQAPFVMCVVGDNALAKAFRNLENKPLHGRAVSVRRVSSDVLDLRRCHAVYFGRTERLDLNYALETLSHAAVLTIGESSDFTSNKGMIALLTDSGRAQFLVNLSASRQAQLNVSSQLLQLASVVGARTP